MAITRLYKKRDFTVESYYFGSRLANGAGYKYRVIYHGEDGKGCHCVADGFYTNREDNEHIARLVKKANAVLKKANEVGKVNWT